MKFDMAAVKSILYLFLVLSGGSMLWNIPTLIMHFGSFDGSQRGLIEMISTYTLQLNFVFFPLLVLVLHREAVMASLLSVLDQCLDVSCPVWCDRLCNMSSVTHHVQKSIRQRKSFRLEETTTEHSHCETLEVAEVVMEEVGDNKAMSELEAAAAEITVKDDWIVESFEVDVSPDKTKVLERADAGGVVEMGVVDFDDGTTAGIDSSARKEVPGEGSTIVSISSLDAET